MDAIIIEPVDPLELLETRCRERKLPLTVQRRVVYENLIRRDYRPSFVKNILRESAFVRYLFLNLKITTQLHRSLVGATAEAEASEKTESEKERLEYSLRAVDVFLKKLVGLVGAKPVLLVLDGDRRTIYKNETAERDYSDWRNKVFDHMATESEKFPSVTVLDMHPVFHKRWMQKKIRLEYPYDWHWNHVGHRVVAEAITGSGFIDGRAARLE